MPVDVVAHLPTRDPREACHGQARHGGRIALKLKAINQEATNRA